MRIRLMAWQIDALKPYFDQVRSAADAGSPGMLVAQLLHDGNGTYVMTPAFLEHELARVITERGREGVAGAGK